MKIYVLKESIDYEIENIRVTTDKQSVLDDLNKFYIFIKNQK